MNQVDLQRILIIDDDIDLLMLLERRLMRENYEIETAASIAEAEDIIPHFCPSLILLDINIKGEDGRKLCWKLKSSEIYKDIKVIMMSGYDYNTGRAMLFRADDLMPKPLNIDFLLHSINQHLQEHNS